MREVLYGTMAAALFASSAAGTASANYTFTLVDVQLTLGMGGPADGTLTGTLTTNAQNDALVSYDIIASPDSSGVGGFEYTNNTSVIEFSFFPYIFNIESTDTSRLLSLQFAGAGLTSAGATLSTSSQEIEVPEPGTRFVSSGTVTSSVVPEPSSLALCGIAGTIGLVVARVRRKRA